MNKKLKDTKVGAWIANNTPAVLDMVDDFVPPVKVLTNMVKTQMNMSQAEEAEFTELATESYKNELNYSLHNTEGARSIYAQSKGMADKLAIRVMNWNLPTMILMVLINIICIKFLDSGLLAVVSNVIGMVLNQLASERNTVVNFFFGSSMGSKEKDKK